MDLPIIPKMEVIDNAKPAMKMRVEHIVLLPELCYASKNPKPGSTLTIRYDASEKLLELFSLDKHINAYIGHPVVRDMEFFAQTIAQTAANSLNNTVTIITELDFNLIAQRQKITVIAEPEKKQIQ